MRYQLSFILGAILLTVNFLQAQSSKGNYNFLDFEQKPYYFGITLATNSSDFIPFRSKDFLESAEITGIESISGPGFNLGIVTNLKVGQFFDLRLLPTLSFAGRTLEYNLKGDQSTQSRSIESVLVEIPFHVRYKSMPFHDKRLFVLAGVKYGFDVASDSRTRQSDELVKFSPADFSLEVGAGAQFFFPYFIFSPELKVSYGMGNILIYDNRLEQSTVLEKILSRTFTLSFHFEG